MKVVIAGGTGFLGRELCTHFLDHDYEIVVLTRSQSKEENGIKFVHWDGTTIQEWSEELNACDILINLTGKSVDCRYTEANKKEIVRSRVDATSILGDVLETMSQPPKLWINASTATIYRHSEDRVMTEENGEIGDDFSMNVAKAWEAAFYNSKTPSTRKVALRVSLVLGKSGGVYPVLRRLAKFGMAGKMGNGKQRFAWIHIDDVTRMVDYIIENEDLNGPINCTSPSEPTNKEFLKVLRKSVKAPFGLPQPKWLLSFGGLIIGTESELILKSRWVFPQKLDDHGFKFLHTTPDSALNELAD